MLAAMTIRLPINPKLCTFAAFGGAGAEMRATIIRRCAGRRGSSLCRSELSISKAIDEPDYSALSIARARAPAVLSTAASYKGNL